MTPDDLAQAVSSFKHAIELDSMFSRAHAALAWAYLSSSFGFDWEKISTMPKELRLMARKHLDLAMRNPTSTAHLVASQMALVRRRYEDAFSHAQLALSFDNNDPSANLNMAEVLMAIGKPEESLDFVNKTMQLDPRNMADALNAAGMAYFIMGDLEKAAAMTERAIKHNPTFFSRYETLSAIYALLDLNQDAQTAYDISLNAWGVPYISPDLTIIMSDFVVKDRQVADRYADGLVRAGFPGQPSEYYKIYEENRLSGEEIRDLVSGQEITVYEWRHTYWFDHGEKGGLTDISRATEGKWWIEGDMICYQMKSGPNKGLNDCGEIYRNPDALPGSKKQYLHVKDYAIAALTAGE